MGLGYKPSKPVSAALLLPPQGWTPQHFYYLYKQPPAGHQVFKYMSLRRMFVMQTIPTPWESTWLPCTTNTLSLTPPTTKTWCGRTRLPSLHLRRGGRKRSSESSSVNKNIKVSLRCNKLWLKKLNRRNSPHQPDLWSPSSGHFFPRASRQV